ncbi:glycoprotein 3-alpha-L-fucosyltransferase A-like isoform X2 [Lingula anatina]|nr:glycoprotein 3-alpha-L-fucosyltransferase A-like isoform X2 [Lingula anatina]|eukprot:XP_013414342.1 glycoprotein 3-alpha-L-fucosyltransferase A-like isoform X2 [Lingula anatina]
MRFYLRRVAVLVLSTVLVLVMVNLYLRESWRALEVDRLFIQDHAEDGVIRHKFHDHITFQNDEEGGSDKKTLNEYTREDRGNKIDSDINIKSQDDFDSVLIQKMLKSPNPYGRNLVRKVWYDPKYDNDRIVAQLGFVPDLAKKNKGSTTKLKKVMVYTGLPGDVPTGQSRLIKDECPVKTCHMTDNRQDAADADAILFMNHISRPWHKKPPNQVWIVFLLESPSHTPSLSGMKDMINWTATYRHDSTIVAPYEVYVPYNASVLSKPLTKNYAAGKTKKVAWFVSNCGARNGRRQYAEELGKYIQVDIYGACGDKRCPRSDKKCFEMLDTDYKFYLSFENSNCRDYITEKFYVNGLGHDVLPITMGAHPDDYKRVAPPHSYINVDDFESPKALAEYLHELDKNDDLYNEYFRWKGTMRTINTYFWCRLCAMVHEAENHHTWYENVDDWWRGQGVCSTGRWKDGSSYLSNSQKGS